MKNDIESVTSTKNRGKFKWKFCKYFHQCAAGLREAVCNPTRNSAGWFWAKHNGSREPMCLDIWKLGVCKENPEFFGLHSRRVQAPCFEESKGFSSQQNSPQCVLRNVMLYNTVHWLHRWKPLSRKSMIDQTRLTDEFYENLTNDTFNC